MLEIFEQLGPFFEDNYSEIGVREYARLKEISPPSASILLKKFAAEGILKSREDRRYLLFRIDRESKLSSDLSKIYWRIKLENLKNILQKDLNYPKLILFGSLSKMEVTKDSDVDIYADVDRKKTDLSKQESILKRKIQIHFKNSISNDLKKSIYGEMEL